MPIIQLSLEVQKTATVTVTREIHSEDIDEALLKAIFRFEGGGILTEDQQTQLADLLEEEHKTKGPYARVEGEDIQERKDYIRIDIKPDDEGLGGFAYDSTPAPDFNE